MNKDLTLIIDYRGHFNSSVRQTDVGMDLEKLDRDLRFHGWRVRIIRYRDVNLNEKWAGKYILYQSTEDSGLYYKDFIEDVLLALSDAGAILVPHFSAFRSHHNKAYQEFYRKRILADAFVQSRVFGCREDLLASLPEIVFPCVLKASAGAKGKNVLLCHSRAELLNGVERISRSFDLIEWLKDRAKRIIRPYYEPVSQHRKKFVVQRYMPNLSGDYKVLVYGNKCVALERGVNTGDFRASGSGKLIVNAPIPMELIRFAFELNRLFGVPCGAYDLAIFEGRPELIEFQFVSFGTTTLFLSERYFEHADGNIREHSGTLDLEQTFAEAVSEFILASDKL